MQKIKLDLENCYGIKKLDVDIDFTENNVAVIYASNGTMKSSLAKTFEAVKNNKPVEERIFGNVSNCNIICDDTVPISKDEIIVINIFNNDDFNNHGLLMANKKLRNDYINAHKSIKEQKDNLYSKLKEKLNFTSRAKFDVESTLLSDFGFSVKEEYECLKEIKKSLHNSFMKIGLNEDELDYASLFNEKACSILSSGVTVKLISDYEKKYNDLVKDSPYMQEGVIDYNNYENIGKSLDDNGFFRFKNEIILNAKDNSGNITIKGLEELSLLMKNEKERILNTPEIQESFERINKILCKNKDTQSFSKLLQKHQNIIIEYKDIKLFKQKVWIKAFLSYEQLLDDLLNDYNNSLKVLNDLRDKAKKETTDWEKALKLFKDRFFVPFVIEPSNQEDVILSEDMPSFKYIFCDDQTQKEVTKEDLLSVLSTGELRAYNILNMIFEILVAKKEGRKCLIILDDISESFDYKNKYAILEYIKDISEYTNDKNEKLFNILLLTHNFDFYRTASSRISSKNNSLIAISDSGEIKFKSGSYTRNIFEYFRNHLDEDKFLIASIPFVRNLIEYTCGTSDPDYITLTNILHYKPRTKQITLLDIQNIFNRHWCKNNGATFANGREQMIVYDVLMQESQNIQDVEDLELENKLILSMSIRLITESYIQDKIINEVANGQDIINDIYTKNNQTSSLIKTYKQYFNDDAIKYLEIVAMITPQNIHLNSFMFEPILDMSSKYLFKIYNEVKDLK